MTSSESPQSRFGYRFYKIKREATLPHENQPFVVSHYILPYRKKMYLRSNISVKMKTLANQKFISVFVGVLFHFATYGQINLPQTPQPTSIQPINPNPSNNFNKQPQAPNQNNGVNVYEEDLKRQRKQREQLNEILNEADQDFNRTINYDLPSCANKQGAEYYRQAFLQLQTLIQSDTVSIKQAVFDVENAYFNNKMSFETYNNHIQKLVKLCYQKLKHDGYKPENKLAKNLVLHQLMSDTLKFLDKKTKQHIIHYPFKYDFDDYMGKEDYSKMFVSKLLSTNSGQCHSMPLLYLILAEEMNTQAYLSYSPNHSFVRFKDDRGKLQNLELTNGKITTEAWILGSGYVKSEALKNKIYLDTLSNKQLLAQCFVDLAHGYAAKYCYDKFVLTCIEEALKYFPNNIFALQTKSDYLTLQFEYVVNQLGRPSLKDVSKNPKAIAIYNQRNEMYDTVDNLGFEPMPNQAYEKWLKSVNDATHEQESEKMTFHLKNILKN